MSLMLKIVFLILVLQNTSFGQSTCRSVLYASEKKTAVPVKFRTALKYSPYIYEGPVARGIEIEANLPESTKRADVALAVIEGLYREFESYNAKESNSKYSMSLRIQSKYGETQIFSADEFLKTSTLADGLADKVISDEILSLSFSDFIAKMEQVAFSNLNGIFNQAKYHSLNILSLTKFGTVEFRLFPSVFDGSTINNYANFSAQLVRAVREKDPDLLNLVFRHEQDLEIPLHELESAIDIKLISL